MTRSALQWCVALRVNNRFLRRWLRPLALYQSTSTHPFGEPGPFPAPKLTIFYREPSVSTCEATRVR